MATLHLTNTTTVENLRKQFNDAFGAQVKLYKGNKVADPADTLASLGLATEGDFECRSSLTVASFIERMKQEHGLKVKVYTCDEWVAVLDGLTLESAGKVKKNAVKADMENMIAYQRSNGGAEADDSAQKADNAAVQAKAEAERAAAEKAKQEDAKAKAEAEKAKAEAAKAQAEAEKAKAAAAAAKSEAEKAAATPAPAATPATKGNKGALPGLFSVAVNKKVRFSMGNLQFNPKKYEFRFAEHQWDIIGKDNERISPTYDGWIDLFGYGTSGYMGCEPTEISKDDTQYPKQDIANTNYDWGVYNPISNGGNKEGLWRTLTGGELEYLFESRPNAAKLRAKACVNGINGGIVLPDDFYEHRVRVPFDSTPNDYSGNKFDLAQWAILEEAGALFLPITGYRYGGKTGWVRPEYSFVKYWLSTETMTTSWDYGVSTCDSPNHGLPVRLVQDVK